MCAAPKGMAKGKEQRERLRCERQGKGVKIKTYPYGTRNGREVGGSYVQVEKSL